MTDFTVSELFQNALETVGQINESVIDATSSTTTFVDSTLKGQFGNKDLKNGIAIVTTTTDGLAPQGQFARISTNDNATYTITVDTALTAAPGVGDVYAFADGTYPYRMLFRFLNRGLRSLGLLDMPPDTTTITMTADQTEYVGAVAWKRSKPYKIEKATTSDTNDYQPVKITDWEYTTAAAGTGPSIMFKKQFGTSYPVVRVYYRDLHPKLTAYSDKIREEIHPELATAAMTVKMMEWYSRNSGGQDENFKEEINKAETALVIAKQLYPMPREKESQIKTIEITL